MPRDIKMSHGTHWVGKEGKCKEFLEKEKGKEIQKGKEKKIRAEGRTTIHASKKGPEKGALRFWEGD